MSYLLADIDATCAALGVSDGNRYYAGPDTVSCLKHLIWILRKDIETHEYRRHIGRANILQTDLLPMLVSYLDNEEIADVLLRLLINLTNPTLLLYREEIPKDVASRRNFVELVDILQRYKEAFADQAVWTVLEERLQKTLQIEWAERSDDQNMVMERILVLVRNVLQVPANPDAERRSDNDASVHDQVLWSLQKSGILDLVLFILASDSENQFQLHALEIVFLMFREQTAAGLADSALKRSETEKNKDEQELIRLREYEKAKKQMKLCPSRHSRFGGTFVMRNMKSISDNDLICYKPLDKDAGLDFDKTKKGKKRSRFVVVESESSRRSAFSIRLFLREFCIQILDSGYNSFVRQIRRTLENNPGGSEVGNDPSYLLWAIKFFMEFNRLNGFRLELVSETMNTNIFHYILTRIQHDLDMIGTDKKKARIWGKRLNMGVKCFNELLLSVCALGADKSEVCQALFKKIQHNVFYMLEYREMALHLMINYNENYCSKSYLRDVVDMANLFIRMLEKFCQGTVYVQEKVKKRAKKGKKSSSAPKSKLETAVDKDELWQNVVAQISAVLAGGEITVPEEEQPLPFDATSDVPIDDQKGDCVLKIHSLLHEERFEHAILLLRAAREVWPEESTFGFLTIAPEEELILLQDIFKANLNSGKRHGHKSTPSMRNRTLNGDPGMAGLIDGAEDNQFDSTGNPHNDDGDRPGDGNDDETDDEDNSNVDDEEEDAPNYTEREFKFDDFAKRLVNPKVVRACTMALADWENISTKSLKSAVTLLHKVAFVYKMPAMLFHAKLFRLFQSVLNGPPSLHAEELRKLAMFIVRQFGEAAAKNPKIYAELLFWKTTRECNDLENGYDYHHDGTKSPWTEEQEDELRRLFVENQENPQTDQDVIDWIVDNLIDKTRTRRAVMKKLKEIGLKFTKPTKKSNTNLRNPWTDEDDNKLRELFEKYHLEEDSLQMIVDDFDSDSKSVNAIVKRLISLGCITTRTDIVKKKQRKNKKNQNRQEDSGDEDEFEFAQREDGTSYLKPKTKPKKKKDKKSEGPKRKPSQMNLKIGKVKDLIKQIEETEFKDVLEWLKESLEDIAEDVQAEDVDQEDAVPIVPIMSEQREAIETDLFKELLRNIGMQEPIEEMETYWRVPNGMKSDDLKLRIALLNGDDVEEGNANADDDYEVGSGENRVSEGLPANTDDDDDDEDVDGGNDSEEDEGVEGGQGEGRKVEQRDRINKRNKLLYSSDDDDEEEALKKRRELYLEKQTQSQQRKQEAKPSKKRGRENVATQNGSNAVGKGLGADEQEEDTESLRLRLNDLIDSDEEEMAEKQRESKEEEIEDIFDRQQQDNGVVDKKRGVGEAKKARRNVIDSDSETDENNGMDLFDVIKESTNENPLKRRERESSEDQEEDDNNPKNSSDIKSKVKRKRIVIQDDDDDDD